MKDKKATSLFQRILLNCGAQTKEYGSCIAAKVPEVERDMCVKEFLALKNCMQNVVIRDKIEETLKMDGQTSSSLASICLDGSGALSHVCILYPPLKCNMTGENSFFYDDGNKLLLSSTPNQVFAWKAAPFDPDVVPTIDSISNGPVLSLRFSLDNKMLAIQRSAHEIQFQTKETGETFSYICKSEAESILGFFWTDCSTCDIVLVKSSGLDFFIYNSELKNLRLVESKKMSISWYVYTHESRLVLLASGSQCQSFVGFQLSSAGVVRLPKFDMVIANIDINTKPVLSSEDIHIITVYGRIYCLQVDRVSMALHLYRFYRDAVVQQGSLPIYSSKIAVSVVDNVLLVHQVDAKVVILYDVYADSRAPISAPLPLRLKAYSKGNFLSLRTEGKDHGASEGKGLIENQLVLYGEKWVFLASDLVCDTANGLLWKIQLDLEAISASSSEAPLILEFLQRRKLEAHKAKKLCLAIAHTLLVERRPVPIVARAMDVLVTSYSNAIKSGSYFKGLKLDRSPASGTSRINIPGVSSENSKTADPRGKSVRTESSNTVGIDSSNQYSENIASETDVEPMNLNFRAEITAGSSSAPLDSNVLDQRELQLTTATITPNEIYQSVFAPVDEEIVGDPAYLVCIIVEFLKSANSERIRIHPNLYVLLIQLLARGEKYSELGLFVINKIIEPSREVAYQLLESGRQDFQTRKLGMDMLRQLSLHNEYIMSLVNAGYYLEALRYARKHKVSAIRPTVFLEAAYASNDSQHLASVLRFLSDFDPGFKSTPDHVAYCHILTDMNSAVVAS